MQPVFQCALRKRRFGRSVRLQCASGLAVVAALSCSAAALAQDADQPAGTSSPAEETVVRGIRGAIVQGLESKRQSDVIVESIKSEDIGKFPDKNLAEALQRIPGVAIDRDGGEGRFVTIRGLGPQFNTVLLNGRRIASENYSRSFSFDTISSDLVAGVNVYKTQQAYIREGGVGGTIDVRTARPLDRPGLHGAVRAEGLYEENSKKLTPNFSAQISDSFFDNKVGVLLSVSRQERRNRTYSVDTNSGFRNDLALTASDANNFVYDNFGVNPIYRQQELSRNVVDEHRVRTGFTADVQARPIDGLELNVDYLYSDFQTDSTTYQVSNWLYAVTPPKSAAAAVAASNPGLAAFASYVAANSKTEIDKNGVMTKIDTNPGAGSQAFNALDVHRPTLTQMLGGNLKYEIDDRLTATLDGAYSSARLKNPGINRRRSFEVLGTGRYLIDATGSVPAQTEVDPGLSANYDNFAATNVRRMYNYGDDIDAKNYEFSGELNWKVSSDFKVRVGGLREVGKKGLQRYLTPDNIELNTYFGSGYAFASRSELEGVTSGISNPDAAKFGQPSGADNRTFMIDFNKLDTYLADPANVARLRSIAATLPDAATRLAAIDAFVANGSSFNAVLTGESARVKETVTSAYFDVDGDFKIGSMPAHVTAGLRYTHTDLQASGFARVLINLENVSAQPGVTPDVNGLVGVYAAADGPGGLTPLSVKNSYNDFLPSLNFKLNLTDNVVFRAAASKSLTRPELDDVTPLFTYTSFSKLGSNVKTNNPGLKPIRSTNYDMSFEWYPARATSLALDLFQKQIDGFIVQETLTGQQIDTLPTTATGDFLPQYNNFTVTRPANNGNVRLRGITASWTQSFAFGGGLQANYTHVTSNRPFDPVNYNAAEVTLPGLGDSLNVIGFFERGPFAARVAWNHRAGFLRNPNFCGGAYCSRFEPVFARSYDQVDARASVNITEQIQVYVEGINITKASLYQRGRFDNLFNSYENFGRRFTFGVSGRF